MKSSEIKAQQPIGMTEGMVLCDIAKLRTTGLGSGIKFHIGDVITIPELQDIQVYSRSFTSKRDNKVYDYEVIKVAFNDRVRTISVASFRRDKNGVDEIADEYSRKSAICRELQMANDDYERVATLAGKTVKVVDVFPGRNYKFDSNGRVPYNKDNVDSYTTSSWPVFEVQA